MRTIATGSVATFLLLSVATRILALPQSTAQGDRLIVTGNGYRVTFTRDSTDMTYKLRDNKSAWVPITGSSAGITFGYMEQSEPLQANDLRATWAVRTSQDCVAVGRQTVLDVTRHLLLQIECLCADDGLLIGTRLIATNGSIGQGRLWSPPRLTLVPGDWDEYAFWGPDGKRHAGAVSALQPMPAYAGVSPWGPQGDTVSRLDARHPALIVREARAARGLGVVFLHYDTDWRNAASFLQHHTSTALYLYAGYTPPSPTTFQWAWLAPFPSDTAAEQGARVEKLVRQGEALTAAYTPLAPQVPEAWIKPLPDFPAALRHSKPARDINQAVVFTMNELTSSDYGVNLARKVGSDLLIRGWFKWNQAPPVDKWRDIPRKIHELGALFGGGITCSALYDHENGITHDQLLDMATRGPDGQLVDAWGQAGLRHGSLSSPAYLDYLFRWCREQIDAGVDCLFMDERTAALGSEEGYDDHSLADFRRYLFEVCPQTHGWAPKDPRWTTELGIPLDNPQVCPNGDMSSFDYRGFLRVKGLVKNPLVPGNELLPLWGPFRSYRDDRAWKELTDRIRAYAAAHGRKVLIDANGIAPDVDLQVLGVWAKWTTKDGHIDLSENQLAYWHGLVVRSRDVAGKRVPVVLFHDWGFGDPPFPWMAVSPAEQEIWMRTRGAEIYAASGFFAFPVLGPFGCDAGRDGTLPTIAAQTAFYQSHRDLYLTSEWLGCGTLISTTEPLSLAAWWNPGRHAVVVHVINRDLRNDALQPRKNVVIRLPLTAMPQTATVISPDQPGEQTASCRKVGDQIELTVPALDAYAVAILSFPGDIDLSRLRDPLRILPGAGWARPARSEFRVRPDGTVAHASALADFLQGMLHTELRNPPTFIVKAHGEARLDIHVRAVAMTGAKLQVRVDDKPIQTVDLPDRDGRNDGNAAEYDKTYSFTIPAGEHRVTVDNIGNDWAVIDWYQFLGHFDE